MWFQLMKKFNTGPSKKNISKIFPETTEHKIVPLYEMIYEDPIPMRKYCSYIFFEKPQTWLNLKCTSFDNQPIMIKVLVSLAVSVLSCH